MLRRLARRSWTGLSKFKEVLKMKACIKVPFFENKGDIKKFSNYRGIKLMSHTMKLWERVFEHWLRIETWVSYNKLGYSSEIYYGGYLLIWQSMGRYREKRKHLYMVFINLEKAYDMVTWTVLWCSLQKKKVHTTFVDVKEWSSYLYDCDDT